MIQNHMLQLLRNVAMEPPVNFTADEVRNEKVKVLRAIHPPTGPDPGDGGARPIRPRRHRGEDVTGYLEERASSRIQDRDVRGQAPAVDNWRWAGVPFYLRTGKRLARKVTEIVITLKARPPPRVQRQ